MLIIRRPASTACLLLSASAYATQVSATEPCFTSQVPVATANAAAAAGAVSVAAADTSTNQILQVLQQRREEKSRSCPTGYILVGTSCEPQTAASEPEPAAQPAVEEAQAEAEPAQSSASGGSSSGGASSSGSSQGSQSASSPVAKKASSPKPKTVSAPKPKPQPAASSSGSGDDSGYETADAGAPEGGIKFGSWAEGYVDYEKLDGLTVNGVDDVSRKQRTAGYNSGSDLSFSTAGGGQFVVGGLGGAMRIKQEFSSMTRSGNLPTDFTLVGETPIFDAVKNITYTPEADITIDLPRTTVEDIEQVQHGQSLGVYGSFMNAGWFVDGLFRVDRMTLEQTTVITDTRITTIQGLLFGNEFDPRGNGNSCFQDLSIPGGDPAQIRKNFDGNNPGAIFGAPVTVREVRRDEVDFENYNFAARIGRRMDINREMGTWWEPSANLTYLYSDFGKDGARLGFDDGEVLTLQGGARWGITRFNEAHGYFWTLAAGAYAFSDVLIDGFTASGLGPTAFEAEEGELRALGTLQFSATWLNGTTWYTEGQIRGGEDMFGAGGKIGGRIQW